AFQESAMPTDIAAQPAAPADTVVRSSNEAWGSRIGLILAMAGNAVGLGNFLRFPGLAAANGGGSFMITYFIAFLLLGIPLMWIEWGIGRNGGRYRKGHIPGMFSAVWHHPAAKYLGVVGLVIPFVVMTSYVVIISWTLAFTFFSLTGAYQGLDTQEAMAGYLRSYQVIRDGSAHDAWTPFAFYFASLFITVYVLSRGISRGIERLAKVGMPVLFLFAVVLAVRVFFLPPGPDGSTAVSGFQFIYTPDFSRLGDATIWLASAGQIFFTLSVGMGTLQTYASYLSTKDDIALSGIATAATNETAEVVLGGSIAIPAAVVFFGVSGAMAVAQSGSYNVGFVAMPLVFQQMPMGQLLGALWFALLFFAGITSSVAMGTPIVAFFREEFGYRRETVAWCIGAVTLAFGLLTLFLFEYQFLWEWDYWAGTFGLTVMATIEVILFMWVFRPENAWRSLHQGADIRIPAVFKFVMTFVTPLYLLVLLAWWTVTEALPILRLDGGRAAGGPIIPGSEPYVHFSRALILAVAVFFLVMIRLAWKRNGYDERAGFRVIEDTPLGEPAAAAEVRR
ncbi:MAG TPA: sodium-dependent transporter, partial [Longimicrobiaceae bacterium]|nr:sodium-dependent transporter [Longimicrobiaceae bacterium]